ncbi:hypothetical protein [Bradyrhizobium paxllaeri]|uniref:hypothetical protein n=1 Tax=Bradyrhizobium paxllaeri TaxID=190148 RepID=UPI000810B196|nr:hypothetical protein [Bradyrhizobium paxllaeri]
MRIDVRADGSWLIHGDIYENGQRIGEYQRNIDWKTKTAESSYFQLNRSATGKDTGKKVLAGNIEKYRQMGIEKVKVHANIDVGGYAWAKYGYVPTLSSWGSLSSEIARKLDRESGGGPGGGSTYTPESWEEISDSDQEEIKEKWMDATREDFINSEIDSWRESGQALDEAKYSLASNFEGTEDWAVDAVSDVIEDWSADETPIPYTPQQILAAISVEEYQTGYDGEKDPDFTFDDDKLKEPSNAPPKEQMNLPGIEQPDLSAHLTQEMRDDITDKLTEAFNDKAQTDAENMDPPDYLAENVADYQAEYWESMRERDKFQWAEDNGALPEIEIEDEDAEDVEPVEVSDDEADALRKLARSNDPKALWAIADSEKGKELLLGTDWWGTLNLKDQETMDRFNAYVGKSKKAAAA